MIYLIAVLMVVLGIIFILCPQQMARLRTKMLYKNVEPSDFMVLMTRVSGIILMILAIVLIQMWGKVLEQEENYEQFQREQQNWIKERFYGNENQLEKDQ